MKHEERIEGALLGLLVGDALGVPYEFHGPESLPPIGAIAMTPPRDFRRAHARTPPGTWSDDGAHALCLLASLEERNGLDLDDLGARLVTWYMHGYLAVDGVVFDVGIQTERALHALIDGAKPGDAGPRDERSNGNGSLMRVLPLALWHRGSDADLVRDAHAQSTVTHGHPRAQMCCAFYCLWARAVLCDREDGWSHASSTLRSLYAGSTYADELEIHLRPDETTVPGGTGYVIDTLCSARFAMAASTYEDAVLRAIALGHDTDTTACVVGGLAGARGGIAAIPARWLSELRGREMVAPLVDVLLNRPSQS